MSTLYYVQQRKPELLIADHTGNILHVMNNDEALANRIVALLNNADEIKAVAGDLDPAFYIENRDYKPITFTDRAATELTNGI